MNLNVFDSIKAFLFDKNGQFQLALMRISLGSTLLYLAISRQFNIDQYNLNSFIPKEEALSIYPDFYRPVLQFFFWPDQWAFVVHLCYILLLFLFILGLSNRFLSIFTWVLAQGFINRNYSMLFGADLIGTLFFFYLSFTNCHDRLSIKSFFKKNKRQEIVSHIFSTKLSSVFYRLMQFQIAVIYAYTGFEKLKGTTWWDGTALWTVFANPQFVNFDFIYLRNFPLLFSIGTFTTLIFEIYFPAMVMFKQTRNFWLILGVLFHLSIGLFMGLIPFSMTMISTYFLFIEKEVLEKFIYNHLNPISARQKS